MEGKEHLNVIDYIGNHRTFLLKPQTLFGLASGDGPLQPARGVQGHAVLPPGCEVTYDLKAVDILRGLLRVRRPNRCAELDYEDFRERMACDRPPSKHFTTATSPDRRDATVRGCASSRRWAIWARVSSA